MLLPKLPLRISMHKTAIVLTANLEFCKKQSESTMQTYSLFRQPRGGQTMQSANKYR